MSTPVTAPIWVPQGIGAAAPQTLSHPSEWMYHYQNPDLQAAWQWQTGQGEVHQPHTVSTQEVSGQWGAAQIVSPPHQAWTTQGATADQHAAWYQHGTHGADGFTATYPPQGYNYQWGWHQ